MVLKIKKPGDLTDNLLAGLRSSPRPNRKRPHRRNDDKGAYSRVEARRKPGSELQRSEGHRTSVLTRTLRLFSAWLAPSGKRLMF